MTTQATFNIPIAKPTFVGSEAERMQKILNSGWVTQGPVIGQFEEAVCDYVGSRFAIATSNCTTSLHLAMLIYGIGTGDEVLCPSYSFVATANGIRHSGATPRFVDIDPLVLNISPENCRQVIERDYDKALINKKTGRKLKAILIVHQIGIPADIDSFEELGREYQIPIIEDAACAIGSKYKNTMIGGSGNVCAFSFHPRKVITTGEGGMLTTDNNELATKARVLRAHGASISDYARHGSASTTYESYDVVGYNYRMTDIQASLGLSQLEVLESFLDRRGQIAETYNRAFSSADGLEIIKAPTYVSKWNHQSYPVRLPGQNRERRDQVMAYMQERGVATRRGIPPIHKFSIYDTGEILKWTEEVSDTSLFLPIYPQMTDAEVHYVVAMVMEATRSLDTSTTR